MNTLVVNEETEGVEKTGSYFTYTGDLITEGSIEIEIPLFVTGAIKAGEWIEAGGGIEAPVKKVFGIDVEFYVRLTLWWETYVFSGHLKIGCELHLVDEWRNFTDDEISEMDENALTFWKENKEMLLSIHDLKSA